MMKNKNKTVLEIKPSMDLCNLYVKGIPVDMTSADLFNIFKNYGRIISSKVMEEDEKDFKKKKRYGFVSFSSSVETAAALIESQSSLTIRFHEPKVPRKEHNYDQQLGILSSSKYAKHFYIITDNKKTFLNQLQSPSVVYPMPMMNVPYFFYNYWNPYMPAYQHKLDLISEIIKQLKLQNTNMTKEKETTIYNELNQLDYNKLLTYNTKEMISKLLE